MPEYKTVKSSEGLIEEPDGKLRWQFHQRDQDKIFVLGYITVDPNKRCQGIGGRLVERAVELAHTFGADSITAEVISREGLDLLLRVLGTDHLTISKLGDYGWGQPGFTGNMTSAALDLPLSQEIG